MIRNVHTLIINDEEESLALSAEAGLLTFIEIVQIDDIPDAQSLLITGNFNHFDFIICDVNFKDAKTVREYAYHNPRYTRESIIPIGPILALPFLAASRGILLPISNFWGDEEVSQDACVATALSLLAAQAVGEPVKIGDAYERLDDAFERRVGHSRPAIATGLKRLRKHIYSRPESVTNLTSLLDRLKALSDAGHWPPKIENLKVTGTAKQSNLEIAVLCDDLGPLTLDVHWRREIHHYSLASLYAEYFAPELHLMFEMDVSAAIEMRRQEAYSAIIADLESIAGKLSAASYVEIVREILSRCDSTGLDTGAVRITEAVTEILTRRNLVDEKHLVTRLVVICAWCQAWHDYRVLNMEQFHGKSAEECRYLLREHVKRILGYADKDGKIQQGAAVSYRRLFIRDGHESLELIEAAAAREAWKRPFVAGKGNIDAYSLDEDVFANLTDLDCAVAYIFAAGADGESGPDSGLGWPGTRNGEEYPRWMLTR